MTCALNTVVHAGWLKVMEKRRGGKMSYRINAYNRRMSFSIDVLICRQNKKRKKSHRYTVVHTLEFLPAAKRHGHAEL